MVKTHPKIDLTKCRKVDYSSLISTKGAYKELGRNQMSYGVSITVKYTETTSTGTITKETNYNFHVDTASNASSLISDTARNAKEMNATVNKVEVTEENQNSYENPYRNLSDREILDLLLTK
jgi:hypothetical protein